MPLGVPRGRSGPTLQATATRLVAADRLSHRGVCRVPRDPNCVRLSLGTINRVLCRGADALLTTVGEIDEAIRASPVVHVDETSWRLAGER